MLLQAQKRYNIDLGQSYLIGDSPRDIEAGANAKVTTIRVKTGHGMKPHTTIPNHYVDTLVEAVKIIEENE